MRRLSKFLLCVYSASAGLTLIGGGGGGLAEAFAVSGGGGGAYDWSRAWYPVAIVKDLNKEAPTRVELLGRGLVLWHDGSPGAGFSAFEDKCPHRLAPLSEGRIEASEDGAGKLLQCAYHGWAFDRSGSCASLPQAAMPQARESRRACAAALPTQELQGLLWVWPDASPEGLEASKATSPAIVEDMGDPSFVGFWYMRDLPYGYETLIENLGDPSHLNFAHHGVIGNRSRAMPLDIKVKHDGGKGRFGKEGYQSELFAFMKPLRGQPNMEVGFQEPSLVYYRSKFTEEGFAEVIKSLPGPWKSLGNLYLKFFLKIPPEKGLLSYFVGYAVPTSPGRCRIILRNSRNFLKFFKKGTRVEEHLGQHLVLDGDTPLLHYQERFIESASDKRSDWDRIFYLPTPSDAPVRAFRRWLAIASDRGNGPTNTVNWPASMSGRLPPLETDRRVLLDRLHSHTLQCTECSEGLNTTRRRMRASWAATVAFLAAAASLPGIQASCTASGLGCLAAYNGYRLREREKRFIFEDYVHSERS